MQCVDHIIEVLDLAGCQDTSEYDGARRKAEGSMLGRDVFRRPARGGHAIRNHGAEDSTDRNSPDSPGAGNRKVRLRVYVSAM